MTEKIPGFAFHVHHDRLIEFCTDYDERVEYIKNNKPKEEQELRLQLFKMIPEEKLPAKLVEAWQKWDEALQKYDEAGQKWDEAWQKYVEAKRERGEAGQKYDEAKGERDEAWQKYDEAWQKYDEAKRERGETWQKYIPELEKLHSELCPDCPWDGKTIFSELK